MNNINISQYWNQDKKRAGYIFIDDLFLKEMIPTIVEML